MIPLPEKLVILVQRLFSPGFRHGYNCGINGLSRSSCNFSRLGYDQAREAEYGYAHGLSRLSCNFRRLGYDQAREAEYGYAHGFARYKRNNK